MNAQPLRIGLDAKRAFTNGTGLGNYARFVINGLLNNFAEHTYYLFTPTVHEQYATFYKAHSNAKVEIVTPQSAFHKQFPGVWRSFYLPTLCNKLSLDVFHGLSNELPFGIGAFKGHKLVTIHDVIFKRYPQYYNPIDRLIYQYKFRYAAQNADTVLATSHQTSADIETYLMHANNVVTYQNCLPIFETKPTTAQIERVQTQYQLPAQFVLSVGTFEPRKRQLELVNTFHKANLPNTHLVLVGKRTNYLAGIEAYIKQFQLGNRIQVLTQVDTADLPSLYHAARAFAYVSEFEGFGIPIVEAMRCGVPIIAAPTSSLVEVGGDAIAYADPTDAQAFSTVLQAALQNPEPDYTKQLAYFETTALMQQLMNCYRHRVTHNKAVH